MSFYVFTKQNRFLLCKLLLNTQKKKKAMAKAATG